MAECEMLIGIVLSESCKRKMKKMAEYEMKLGIGLSEVEKWEQRR